MSSFTPLFPGPHRGDVGDVGDFFSFLRAEPMMIVDDPDGRRDEITDCVDRVVLHLFKVSCTVVQGYLYNVVIVRGTKLVVQG